MAVTHGTPTRNAIADAVAAKVDGGGGPGKFKVRDASNVVLATITLAATSHNAAVNGVATLAGLPKTDSDADANGTATNFIITDAADVTVYGGSLTVTGGGGDYTIDSVIIAIHQTVSITSGSYTAPP